MSASAASEADGRVSRGTRTWGLLFGIAVVVQAAALTAWPRIVTVDGPAHLAGAAALLHSGDVSQALYRVDPTPVPNLLQTLLLAALLSVTGPDGAERMLVLAYALGLPLAMRCALRGVQPQSGWLAVAAVPFVGGYLYTYGFYDFCLGLVGMLLVMGFALRQRTGWSATATATLSLLLLLTWIAHLLPLVVAGIFVVVLALCRVNGAPVRGAASADRSHAWAAGGRVARPGTDRGLFGGVGSQPWRAYLPLLGCGAAARPGRSRAPARRLDYLGVRREQPRCGWAGHPGRAEPSIAAQVP